MFTTTADEDFSDAPITELGERWEAAMSAYYVPVRVRVDRDASRGTPSLLRRHEMEDLALVELSCGRCAVENASAPASEISDDVALIIVEDGGERVSSVDRQNRLQPGDVVLWDPRKPAAFQVDDHAVKHNLLIPRAELRTAIGREVDLGTVPLGGPCLLMLSSMINSFVECLPQMTPAEARSVRNASIELVAGAIRNGVGVPESARSQLRTSVEAWIERNLTRELTPAFVAAEHAISVRTLNRLFSERGETLGSYVRERRLERARNDVIATDLPLTAIAHRWHFSDGSHFTRQFVGRFGTTPNSLRRAGR